MAEQPKKKVVLIVDDEQSFLTLLESRLLAAGYDVLKATNGMEAIAVVKQTAPDLIVMDWMMPKMDGVKACALLKADKRFRKIPLIMTTAVADKSELDLCSQVGADVSCNKPLDINELLHKVSELINRV